MRASAGNEPIDFAKIEGDILAQAIERSRLPLCLSDPKKPGNPIVYANPAFCELTGYALEDVLGKNCRFLQGPETTAASIAKIRQILSEERVGVVEIMNYRKDGTLFTNALQVGPVYDQSGKLNLFFGSQLDVSLEKQAIEKARKLADDEQRHRLRNIVNVLTVLTRITGSEHRSLDETIETIVARIRAVGTAHLDSIVGADGRSADIASMLRAIVLPYCPNGDSNLSLVGDVAILPTTLVTPVSLLLHELATNAVKHGAFSVRDGHVRVEWVMETVEDTPVLRLVWRESGGPALQKPSRESGSDIVKNLVNMAGGTLDFEWQIEGLIVTLLIPIE